MRLEASPHNSKATVNTATQIMEKRLRTIPVESQPLIGRDDGVGDELGDDDPGALRR